MEPDAYSDLTESMFTKVQIIRVAFIAEEKLMEPDVYLALPITPIMGKYMFMAMAESAFTVVVLVLAPDVFSLQMEYILSKTS